VNRLSTRLERMESRLHPPVVEPRGSYEIHYLNAWPGAGALSGVVRCEEHPPACGVQYSPTLAPGRQVLILRCGPWLGSIE
jgi:hypothetical protein